MIDDNASEDECAYSINVHPSCGRYKRKIEPIDKKATIHALS